MANLWNGLVQKFNGNKKKAAASFFVIVAFVLSTPLALIAIFANWSALWFCIVYGFWFGCILPFAKSMIKSLVVNGDNGIHKGWWFALGFVLVVVLAFFFIIFQPDKLPPLLSGIFKIDKLDKQHLAWFTFVYILTSNVMGLIWGIVEGELFANPVEQIQMLQVLEQLPQNEQSDAEAIKALANTAEAELIQLSEILGQLPENERLQIIKIPERTKFLEMSKRIPEDKLCSPIAELSYNSTESDNSELKQSIEAKSSAIFALAVVWIASKEEERNEMLKHSEPLTFIYAKKSLS